MLAARMVYRQADEAFEEGIKKEATNPENFDYASIHHNMEAVIESRWDAEKTTENIEDDFTDGLNKEVTDPVDDAAIHDIEKAVVEIHRDDDKMIKL